MWTTYLFLVEKLGLKLYNSFLGWNSSCGSGGMDEDTVSILSEYLPLEIIAYIDDFVLDTCTTSGGCLVYYYWDTRHDRIVIHRGWDKPAVIGPNNHKEWWLRGCLCRRYSNTSVCPYPLNSVERNIIEMKHRYNLDEQITIKCEIQNWNILTYDTEALRFRAWSQYGYSN